MIKSKSSPGRSRANLQPEANADLDRIGEVGKEAAEPKLKQLESSVGPADAKTKSCQHYWLGFEDGWTCKYCGKHEPKPF